MAEQLRLTLVLNPADTEDMSSQVTAPVGDRVFMRIFATNDSSGPVEFDQLTCEIYANWGSDVLALAPSDCPHAGDLADLVEAPVCAVSERAAVSGGLQAQGDPANGTELDLVQTLVPGSHLGGWGLGTGKAGLQAVEDPFVLEPEQMVHVADGRTRKTGMIAKTLGTTPVVALGFASMKGVPLTVAPAYAAATVVEASSG